MNLTLIYTLVSVFVISLVSLIGIFVIIFSQEITKNRLLKMVSLSAGAMLGGAFLHLLPESLETMDITTVSTTILAGLFTSYIVEMVLHWRHCHIPSSEEHPHTFVYMNLIGDGVHNFIDGLVIAGAFQLGHRIGFVTCLAIILHEIPQEIGDFGVIVYGGVEARKALYYNLLSGLAAFLGVFFFYTLDRLMVGVSGYLVPFAVGNFIYIAGSDLVPEIRDEKDLMKGLTHFFFMLMGVFLLYLVKFIE